MLAPSDHLVRDVPGFLTAVDRGAEAAARGRIVTFGANPDRAETGYGYVERGEAIDGGAGSFCLKRFVEKPDRATAESYLARSEEHTSELQSLMRISYAVFCLKKKKNIHKYITN